MKPKTTIVLIVLLAGCIGYVVVAHTDLFKPAPPAEAPETTELVLGENPADPVALTIDRPDGIKVVLAKRDGKWWVLEPFEAESQQWRVTDVTRMFDNLKYRRVFSPDDPEEGIPDERTGLDKPEWTLTLVDANDRTYRLHIGKHVFLTRGAMTYVRPNGSDRTYVVQMDFHAELRRNVQDYRKQTVLKTDIDDIVRVKVAGSENYELLKDQDDEWQIVAPVAAAADNKKVRSFIDRFSTIRAVKFVDDKPTDLAPYGLDNPRLIARIWVKPKEADEPSEPTTTPAATAPSTAPTTAPTTAPARPTQTHAIAVGNVVGQRAYAKLVDAPGVFFIERHVLENLQPPLLDLRSKKLLHFNINRIRRIDLDLPTGRAQLIKRGQTWRMVAPFEGPVNEATINTLLTNLALPKIQNFRDKVTAPAGLGLAPPRATITVHVTEKDKPLTLMIGGATPSGEMTFVKQHDSESVAVVRSSDIKYLLATPANYFSPKLLELSPAEQITDMIITRSDVTYVIGGGKRRKWRLTSPLQCKAEAPQINKVLDSLTTLTGSEVVALAPEAPDEYANAQEKITIEFETTTPPPKDKSPESQPTTEPSTRPAAEPILNSYIVHVVKTGGGCYGWVGGGEVTAVGKFAETLYETLSGELRDHEIWTLKGKKIENIKRITDGETFELTRRKDEWVYAADPYVKIDDEKVTKFLDNIRQIRTERFVSHKSAEGAKFGLDAPWFGLELTTSKPETYRLVVSNTGSGATQSRYASSGKIEGVFVLPAETIEKLTKTLKDFTE